MHDLLDRLRAALPGRYAVLEELGHGGMAVVFLADDRRHGRRVALKVLRPELAAVVGRERFLREIQIAAGLSHPHVVPLHDSGEADGLPYFVMPHVAGESLRTRLAREGRLALDDAVALVEQVAAALDHAHARGVVHRDVKPENILLQEGQALVADFGIAAAVRVAGGERLTGSGISLGTPEYMSPEQAGGEGPIDARSDVYALGAVCYEMLVGEPPHTGTTMQAVFGKLLTQAPVPPRVVRPDLPAAANDAVLRALAKVPADRFASAGAFARALRSGERTRSRPLRRTVAAWAVGVVAVSLLAVGLGLRGGRPTAPEVRDWILVADFRGPPDDPDLAVAARNLVLADLNQSTFLSTVPDDFVAGAMRDAGLPESTRVDARLGAELAYRTAVRVVLVGSVDRIGDSTLSIVLHVLDAEDRANIMSEATTATEGADFVGAVQQAVRSVRLWLGERPDVVASNRPLMRVRTADMAALRRFVSGIEATRVGNNSEGRSLLHAALDHDTAFAAAWAALATNYIMAHDLDSARAAAERAARHRERLTDAAWYQLQANLAYTADYDLPAAVRWHDLVLQEQPRSVAARNNRALYLSSLGRHEEALREFERALVIDPLHRGPRQIQIVNVAAELIVLGRVDSARRVARALEGPYARFVELQLLHAEGDWAAAAARSAAVAADPSTQAFVALPAVTGRAAAEAALGRVDTALGILGQAIDTHAGAAQRWFVRARWLLETAAGRPVSPPPPAVRADTVPAARLLQGLLAAARGDTVTAAARLTALERLPAADQRRLGHGRTVLRALIDARAGRWEAVTAGLAPAAAAGEHDPFSLDRVTTFAMRWLLADAYARRGHRDSAAVVMEALLSPVGYPPAQYCLRGLTYGPGQARLAEWRRAAVGP